MPETLHGTGYYPRDIASIMSLMMLGVSLGGTFTMTLMFTIFNNEMHHAGISLDSSSTSSFDAISQLPPDTQAYIKEQATVAISLAFFAMSAFLWVGVPAMAFLGNVNLKTKSDGVAGARDFSNNVVKGSYVSSLVRELLFDRSKGPTTERSDSSVLEMVGGHV